MSWIADETKRRIYDPEAGAELFVDSSGSDQVPTFRLESSNGVYYFSAQMVFPKISESERKALGLLPAEEMVVWQLGPNPPSMRRSDIKNALLTYKSGGGFHYPKTQYFVQFGAQGRFENT